MNLRGFLLELLISNVRKTEYVSIFLNFIILDEHRFLPWVTLQRPRNFDYNTECFNFSVVEYNSTQSLFDILAHVRNFERTCDTKVQFYTAF